MRARTDGLCTNSGCIADALNRGFGICKMPADPYTVGDTPAPVAFDHARVWMGPLGTRVWSVGSLLEPGMLTIRMDRGVGLRPPSMKGSLGADEWNVDAGAGGGGLLGSQEGYPSDASDTLLGDAEERGEALASGAPVGELEADEPFCESEWAMGC